ncbi:ribosome-associated translation inhibitor RaiA [Periweissella fabaria]|uniref:Ribosome hibernation promoting factor n=1 Tax=Periweissella fabaria TaxID=546157 RepID=A0ABN8BJF3_9LACO|nr:ribosome-associated translation inhibitor RaiA [Periweissella fabaria]MCM0596806.1 ribosome-associated translation inhibitor RaiA [Periweissella fabaria]CAH0416543.1 Ribosome hibernation promotion factor [Periweissella fabaria]
MLKIDVRGVNIEVTDAIREYVEKRLEKLNRFLDDTTDSLAHVKVGVYPEKAAKVEVTIPLPYLTLRAEHTETDLYAAIDLVVDKLERQIRKHKTKVNRKSREKGYKGLDFVGETVDAEVEAEDKLEIVRNKHISLKPMDSEEAVLQMELLGHEFFIFEDEDQRVNVVYRRADGRYGLIEAERD